MNNTTRRINLWVGVVLAIVSTSATAYYLFTLMAYYPWPVQVISSSTGASLEIARYSLTVSRDRVLPVLLFLVSVGCSWAAMNTAFTAVTTDSYLLESYKQDREEALREADRLEGIDHKSAAKDSRERAGEILAKIEALEAGGPAQDSPLAVVNQGLIVLIALLIDITSVRCLLLATGTKTPPLSTSPDPGREPERVEEHPPGASSETVLIDQDPLITEARELIASGKLRASKNAIKQHFRIGWDRASRIHEQVTNDPLE